MTERCFLGTLRLRLQCGLESTGGQDNEDKLLHETLSWMQSSLDSTSLFVRRGQQLQMANQNCVFLKDVEGFCLDDLKELTCNLIALLASENSFTTHSVGKTFMALFCYLHESVSLCRSVADSLWLAVQRCFGCEEESDILKRYVNLECHVRNHESSTFGLSLGMHLFQILHDILNKYKQEGTPHLEGFVTCSVPHIYKSITALITHFSCLISNSIEGRLEVKDDLSLAVTLRFLCSFVHAITMCGDAIDTHTVLSDSQIIELLVSFLKAISNYCLNPQQEGPLSHYLCHKLLMLMFRLHTLFTEWPLLALTCSEILRSNANFLCPSLFVEITSASSLICSPFARCLAPTKSQLLVFPSASQPEKYAVFLIFKLELSLMKDTSIITTRNGSVLNSKERQGKWMYNWLLSKVEYPSTSHFAELANGLASSFLQIFMDEDILLLEILLLLQDCPVSDLFTGSSDDGPTQIAPKFLVEIFKPVRLLAVFLSLISYDHSVIIDFLIERGTSILCLQYLLRSMRIVRSTWPDLLSLSNNTSPSGFMETGHCKMINIDKLGMCLIKLRDSIARLHDKQAFPYNPSTLLKHLGVVQSLLLGNFI